MCAKGLMSLCNQTSAPTVVRLPIYFVLTGIRSLEIDIFPDPVGGTYDQSVVLRLAGSSGWMNNSALQQPGFKVSIKCSALLVVRVTLMLLVASMRGVLMWVC